MGASMSVVSMVVACQQRQRLHSEVNRKEKVGQIFTAIFVSPVTTSILTKWLFRSWLGKYLGLEFPSTDNQGLLEKLMEQLHAASNSQATDLDGLTAETSFQRAPRRPHQTPANTE